MEFVNWDDDISNWMEKHVPNDQPDTIYTVDISIISEPRPSISMVKLTHFKRPTREGHLGALCYSVGHLRRNAKTSDLPWAHARAHWAMKGLVMEKHRKTIGKWWFKQQKSTINGD
jgi:hypothetical protein